MDSNELAQELPSCFADRSNRRRFIKTASVVALAGTLGFLPACDSAEPDPSTGGGSTGGGTTGGGTTGGGTGGGTGGSGGGTATGIALTGNQLTIDTTIVTELDQPGGFAFIRQVNGQNVRVIVVNERGVKAFTAVCTHTGRDVSMYLTGSMELRCPTHGSQFDLNGRVTQGPASRSLTEYAANRSDSVITVTLP